ncbi:MAG TPA: branched-chain amino acid ABC transporter permease [Burkholderiaceae bacterium]|jgi:branched-chain amino acid transport system permease protein|nr:branched-chain amino acid ABC transporter permease [Burkholderiaceae bacterium]
MKSADLVQLLISGIAMGSIYTLMGKGLLITFLTTRALNFGQGDFLMIASFLSMTLLLAGVPVIVAVLIVVAVLVVLGVGLERLAIRPLASMTAGSASSLAWILTTMGFGMLLQNTAQLVWGKSRFYSPPLFSAKQKEVVEMMGARFYLEELIVAVLAMVVVAVLYWFLFRARWGKEVQAVSFDKATASLLGIDVRRVVATSYAIMAVLAAVSGILAGPLTTVQAHMGLLFILKGFAVVCIGGFVNPVGILIAGLGFGIVEAVSNYINSAFGDLYPFLIALLFLIARPSGLFGEMKTDVR